MSDEVADRVRIAVADFDARVRATPADKWTSSSPCEGWTARDIVVHVADNYLNLSAGVLGGEATKIASDEDIVAGWARAKSAMEDVLTKGDLSKSIAGPMGPMPAEQLLGRLVTTDTLVHTWDLARAVGGDERLNAEFVAAAYSGMKPMDAMIRRPGVFGPKIDAPASADLQTEFLNFLGRKA